MRFQFNKCIQLTTKHLVFYCELRIKLFGLLLWTNSKTTGYLIVK